MIVNIRHKGLKLLYEKDDPSKLTAEQVNRLRLILSALDAGGAIEDMDQPAFRHPLKGDLKGYWAVTVRANWRVVFRFANGQAMDVDLADYH